MISSKGIAIKFLVLVLVSLSLFMVVSGEMKVRCIEREREALLSFKSGLTDEDGFLSSWGNDEECCKWYGVVCSNNTSTGNVIRLQLDTCYFDGVLGGKVSSSLLELHHLYYLDLSCNDFGGDPIPEFIGSMKQLQHLYLWDSNFSGIVPPQIGNLTNLRSLDLSFNSLRTTQNLDWLSNLSLLSFLDLSQLDLSHTNMNLQHILSSLGSLQELYLQNCSISDLKPPSAELPFVNSSSTLSLSTLDLSRNHLTCSVFQWLANFSTSLVKIDLSENALAGQLNPNAFETLIHLEHLDLSDNMLEGEILKSLGNLTHLRVLVLYENGLKGQLDELLGNLSSKGMLESLQILELERNQFNGAVPDLRPFSALRQVYLGSNNFTGSLPLSLGQLSKLHILDVSDNHLEGTISESHHLTKLNRLKVLDLSSNSFILQISPDWIPPFQLDYLMVGGCNMGPLFPRWIQTQKNLLSLDLSSAGIIIDELPMWLWSLSPSLEYLFLSDNQISGTIPHLPFTNSPYIDLSSNKLSGPIPSFHPNTQSLQLSQNMFFGSISSICKIHHEQLSLLDLSSNQLSGEIPDCWEKILPNLLYLNLGNNSFSGKIPHSLGSLTNLNTLRLSDNNLSGELPSTLRFIQELKLIDVGGNELITGEIPAWIGELYQMQYLILRRNKFYGGIPPEICNLTRIRILDISMNNLSGRIPDCFNNLAALAQNNAPQFRHKFGLLLMVRYNSQLPNWNIIRVYQEYSSVQWKGQESEYKKSIDLIKFIDFSSNKLTGNIPRSFSSMRGLMSLNLSRNRLTGNIIPDIGQMEMLESLDLSQNHLSGKIPASLEKLHFLSVLDLSNNNLSGKIPSSTQLQGFNVSSYAGNSGLCGRPLALCPEDRPSQRSHTTTQGEKDDGITIWKLSFMQGLGISMAFGFIVGFWGVVAPLLLKKSWRYAYFNFLDDAGNWFLVRIAIFLSKLRRS